MNESLKAEYSAALLMLVSVEAQNVPATDTQSAHVKRLDRRLAKLRTQLDPEEIAAAEQVVNKVDRKAKAILAGR